MSEPCAHPDPPEQAAARYAALAGRYDQAWADSPVEELVTAIVAAGRLGGADRIADVGCGTGLYARRLAVRLRPRAAVLCVDPSPAMLAELPADPALRAVCASAEQLAGVDPAPPGARLPPGSLDAILIKEAIHHVPASQRAAVLAGLAALLAPGGRLLVVMLPTRIDYPLFPAALDRFAARQPDPETVVDDLRAAGLATRRWQQEFPRQIAVDRYLSMVRGRYMSVLATFTDAELDAGVVAIAAAHPGPWLRFSDRFEFVLGTRTPTPARPASTG
ncbi:class I SAM-dependent methyltransferase [Frankia sp. AgPm24]|uniref:class I SAM-dependent methyltransferase n=1 Tax=Frankia sp. AgPm24 TaxID=631128 RepID=UPI00200F9EA6|nr:class I SAM-dependent methyltransferase [Frankia sp. AgPm24]MCK9921996.1 class I SAM-dependent methyltransferase [Frankia sp. AgPm24]